MIGLDTNLLVRLFEPSNEEQTNITQEIIRDNAPHNCFINHIVLIELIWVLEFAYKFKKEQLVFCLQKIIYTSGFTLEARDEVIQAFDAYLLGRADFSDYLIGIRNHALGCETTYSFDKKAYSSSPFFKSALQ